MKDARRVLESRFERISKNTDFCNLGKKTVYKRICGKYGDYGHSSNKNCSNSNKNNNKIFLGRVPTTTAGRAAPMIILPETNLASSRSATDVADKVIYRGA